MTIGAFVQVLASLIYLLPAVVAVLWLLGRPTPALHIGLWIPGAQAADLLASLAMSALLPLGASFVVSRAICLGAIAWLLQARRPYLRRPSPGALRFAAWLLVAGVIGFTLSASISRPTSIWDRQFHIPLVTMMRGQRLPFLTVYQPSAILHFHFAGDAIAVALQTFSAGRMHSAMALALMHDLMLGVTAMSLAAWLQATSPNRLWLVPAVLAVLLSGPLALFRTGMGSPTMGYSFFNVLTMSYRPSIAATLLFCTGGFLVLWSHCAGLVRPGWGMLALIGINLAVLGIADEPTAAILGVGAFAVWVAAPEVLFRRRKHGPWVLAGFAMTILLANFAFQAALVPGGPVQKVQLTSLRSPGFAEPPVSLEAWRGLYALLLDTAPFLLVSAAAIGLAMRRGARGAVAGAAMLVSILMVATFGLTALDFNGMAIENHRFMTIVEMVFPLAALGMLARLPSGRWERLPLIGALGLSAVSTFHWYQYSGGGMDELYTNPVDCRRSAGATWLEAPRPTYVPYAQFYEFAGCRPVFFPGTPNVNSWSGVLLNGYPTTGRTAFELLHRTFVGHQDSLRLACPVGGTPLDAACAYALRKGNCAPAGARFTSCELSGPDRAAVLATVW